MIRAGARWEFPLARRAAVVSVVSTLDFHGFLSLTHGMWGTATVETDLCG